MFGQDANLSLLTEKKSSFFFFDESPFDDFTSDVRSDVMILTKFVSPKFCRALIEFFEAKNLWTKSVTYGEIESGLAPELSPRQSVSVNLREDRFADGAVHNIFGKALEQLNATFGHTGVVEAEAYALLKYGTGGEYKAHIDQGSKNGRCVSGLIYLNDDYEGGELHFPRFDFTLRPKTGMVVMFPSSYTHLHAALPVTSGTKYAVVTWFK